MIEIPSPTDRKLSIIRTFLNEVTLILDSKTPLSRRAALTYKWCWLFHGLGYKCEIDDISILTSRRIYEEARKILTWVSQLVRESEARY